MIKTTFDASKRSLKSRKSDKHETSVKNCDCEKNEMKYCWKADHNFSWDQKKKNC